MKTTSLSPELRKLLNSIARKAGYLRCDEVILGEEFKIVHLPWGRTSRSGKFTPHYREKSAWGESYSPAHTKIILPEIPEDSLRPVVSLLKLEML